MALFGLLSDNSPLSSPEAQIQIAAGLLSGKGNLGANLSTGLLGAAAAQQQERANRASDLQQLTGAYQMLKQQEFAKMLAARQSGIPYSPNPMLPQMEQRLAQLTGLPNLSNQGPVASRVPPAAPIVQSPAAAGMPPAGMAPPSQSPMADPNYQPPMVRPPQQQAPQESKAPQDGLGGPAGGIPMEAWLAQDPSGASYLKQLAEDNKPIVLRQGDLVKKNPDGTFSSAYQQPQLVPGVIPQRDGNGQVTSAREIPGFSAAASGIKSAETGATEQARAPFSFQNVQMAGGGNVPMSISQLMGRGGAAPAANSSAPAAGNVAQVTVAQPPKPAAPQQQADPWTTIPKRPVPQGIGQTTYDASMSKLQADTASKLAEKYGANADTAQQRIALNSQAKELVDRSDTGMGAAMLGDVKNLLVSRFGIPQSDFANDPAATAALNKDLMNAAVAKAKASFGARMSTNEVNNMLKRGAPNGDMLASAIKFLLDTDTATAQYQIDQGNNLGRYLSMGGDPLQFESWHAKTFPLSRVLDQMHLPPNTSENNNANYGWSVKRVN
jgi:hypothetical protein